MAFFDYTDADLQLSSVLLRGDREGAWPAARNDKETEANVEFVNALQDTAHNNPMDFSALIMPSSGVSSEFKFRDMMTEDGVYGFAEGTSRRLSADYRNLREECGFGGTVISDCTSGSYRNAKQMAYAGGALNLNNQKQYARSDFDSSDVADATVIRRCAQDVMYTVVNSNAVNGEIIGYMLPFWQILLIVVDCVLFVGLAVWGFFAIRKSSKKTEPRMA